MSQKLFIKTYGCQINEYDSARIVDLFIASGEFEITQNPEQADVILLNTCSVREKAQEKVFSDLGRFRLIKRTKPHLIIGVGGCVARQDSKAILQRAPFVDIIFGPQTIHRVWDMYESAKQQRQSVDISLPGNEKFSCLPKIRLQNPSAFVTIMEGCNNFCSYCIVPYTRGREISRSMQDVMNEIKTLITQGAKEIIVLGQNVNNYQDAANDLVDLINKIAQIEQIKRIRFITSNPFNFPDRLIQIYENTPKLASHLHLPVQSGSDRILQAMHRHHTVAEYKSIIQKLRIARPNISISSDFIVGFPKETEEDFEATLRLVREIEFDHSFSFIYSPRPHTLAAKLSDAVPLQIKKERLKRLQNELLFHEQHISQNMVGTLQSILVTATSKKNDQVLMGRTENNRIVNFEGPKNLIGQLITVKITEALPNSLRGERVSQ
jgi:tRNA-2-methylthio-N6-dimethylallyladenosine synthase